MKKGIIIIIVIAAVIAGYWYLMGKHTPQKSNSPMANMTVSPSPSSAAQATNTVAIRNFAFSPSSITVTKGTTVTWTNFGSTEHTVTEDDNKTGPSSSPIPQNKTYSFTYNSVGTFHYHCSIHPDMTASVTVTN